MIKNNNQSTNRFVLHLFASAVFVWSFFGLYIHAEAATLSVSPQTGVYTVGSVFTTQIRVNTQGAPINAAEGTLKFNPQKLSVVGVSKGSIFNLWTVEPTHSNAAGTITFGGGSPAGYTGGAGTIISVTFRALSAGDTSVSFSNGSVLAADGRGTNVLSNTNSAAFTLMANDVPAEPEVIEYVAPPNTPAAPVVISTTHKDAAGWYTNTSATLSWDVSAGITAVRTLLDENSGSVPTKVYETPIDTITIDELEDGVSYFHLQFRNAEGWGRVAHYRLAVDTQKPSEFTISLPEDADLSNPDQILVLEVTDEPSGIERYMVQVDGGEPFEYIDETGSSTITLPELSPGHHSVIIEAFDYAGNSLISTFSFAVLAFDRPVFTEYPSQINSEVIPVIKGQTRPNAEVSITLSKVGGNVVTTNQQVVSDETGVFTFIPDGTLRNGVYELTAVATDVHGAKSEPSDAVRIAVQDPGYIVIGTFIVSILSVIVPLVSLTLLLVLAVMYFLRRLRLIRGVVVKETAEALQVLTKEFEALQTELKDQRDNLVSSRKTKKLTKAETELVETMEAALRSARSRVAKEIGDVDDIVE